MRRYHCDPLGHVLHTHAALRPPLLGGDCHAPDAGLDLPRFPSLLEFVRCPGEPRPGQATDRRVWYFE